MLPDSIALVSESRQTNPSQLTQIAHALQTQVLRDFGPLWNVQAAVSYYPELEDIPVGALPVIVRDELEEPGALGYHVDEQNQPYALVQYTDTLSLTISHETLEMLADRQGNRTQAGASPQNEAEQVQFLVEVCDPCEDASYAYSIEGVLVSDFITPNFYDPVASPGTKYSFTGAIPGPRQILKGGYISYLDLTTNHMWQQIWLEANPEFRDLGPATPENASLREWVDRQTPHPQLESGAPHTIEAVARADGRRDGIAAVRAARAQALRAFIAS